MAFLPRPCRENSAFYISFCHFTACNSSSSPSNSAVRALFFHPNICLIKGVVGGLSVRHHSWNAKGLQEFPIRFFHLLFMAHIYFLLLISNVNVESGINIILSAWTKLNFWVSGFLFACVTSYYVNTLLLLFVCLLNSMSSYFVVKRCTVVSLIFYMAHTSCSYRLPSTSCANSRILTHRNWTICLWSLR
jgi:hypothetical protein